MAPGELGDLTIEVIPDKEAKTLIIRDKGIGLTAEEAKIPQSGSLFERTGIPG